MRWLWTLLAFVGSSLVLVPVFLIVMLLVLGGRDGIASPSRGGRAALTAISTVFWVLPPLAAYWVWTAKDPKRRERPRLHD